MEIVKDFEVKGTKMVYRMPRELDDHVAAQLRANMDVLIDSYGIRELVMDFENTRFMDSSGVGVIIGRCRKLGFYDGRVYAVNCNERMKKLFAVSGLNEIVMEEV